MLQSLFIQNFAIIESLEVKFETGMNVITGETGAGKSILLGALSLVLGERADMKSLLDATKKCVIEATFRSPSDTSLEWLSEFDIDTQVILRREIAPTGKSRAFINDTPATLQQVKELGEILVNRHSQHETLDLIERGFQLNVLDTYSGLKEEVKKYVADFRIYRKTLKELETLRAAAASQRKEEDFLKFQLQELSDAALQPTEQSDLEAQQNTLANVESLQTSCEKAVFMIGEAELSLLHQMSELTTTLRPLTAAHPTVKELYDRSLSIQEELRDIERTAIKLNDSIEANPERLEEINQRLNLIFQLQKKHQVDTVERLLGIQQELETTLSKSEQDTMTIAKLEKSCETQLKSLQITALQLHKTREKNRIEASQRVTLLLQQVGMPTATFQIELKQLELSQLSENGLSDITFLFSANKGFAPKSLKEVASGGELSRLMLCIKSLLADADHTPTNV
jgi:DNA repair protein RecN (Recombination protein N)